MFSAKSLVKCLAIGAALTFSMTSRAEYPNKPIRVVVPYAAGGTTDAISRMIGEKLSGKLGQPVVVENKPGGSEQVAMSYVKLAPADGYTIVISTVGGLSVNPSLYGSKLSYNPQKDLVPVVLAASLPSVFFVNPSVPVKTLDELTDYLKKNPGKVNYGSSGPGQPSHLAMELYKSLTGVDVNHVPYKGGAPALQDLAAGHVQVMVAIGAEGMPFVKAGKLKALAVTTATRTPLFPELVPAAESKGMKGFEMPTWYGYLVKTGTSNAIVHRLNVAFNEVLQDKDLRKKMNEMGIEVLGGTPQDLDARIKQDTVKWGKVVHDAHITLE
ncbi:conserved exported hypothetical protein [Cupriavidus taiwanensis]|uniref:Extra-cytoplasmic solute receptor n=2 Tax=Cupriavidus taiwanensis TaxID=164546 RepID=A0A7Z7JGJ2_9BURK|nr:conserved exported hypothetical protein [Cupriavidus taiwanensis]SPC26187.1 conserved exported hypothetical protein [Cupriavidus taiwanensis]